MAKNNLAPEQPMMLNALAIDNRLSRTPMMPVKTTQLLPNLEKMYRAWVVENRVPESNDYDMRGFFLSKLMGENPEQGVDPSDMMMHYTDEFKLPNHPSFSRESRYSRTKQDPRWVENPAPYQPGSWALRNKTGNIKVDVPL